VEQKITITPQADTSPWTFPQTPQADASPWSKVEARIPPPSNTTAERAGGENKNLKDLEQAQPNSSRIKKQRPHSDSHTLFHVPGSTGVYDPSLRKETGVFLNILELIVIK
jgi:hypothetical protein